MTLDEWLSRKSMTNDAFGQLIGAKGETVRRYRAHKRFPTPEAMQRIIDATSGDVTANDWFDVPANTGAAA